MRLANTDAPTGADVPEARPPVAYTESAEPTPITNPITTPIVQQGGSEPTPFPFRASGTPNRGVGRRATAFFLDVKQGWSLASGDTANGLHAVIARQANGMPAGEQAPWPTSQPATLFRPPAPWDRGTTRATGNAGA